MKRLLTLWALMTLPILSLAEEGTRNPLNFTPPPTDYSMVFLNNIFGVVDGVLHGTGSQILGEMFGIFNAALLAVGGMILLYIMVVSTVNTAHEGEFLGRKFNSIWIPIRTVLGVALLIPKSTGYCLMQVFFMWVIVQGVGAADRVWGAALGYMQRGGVLIQEQASDSGIERPSLGDNILTLGYDANTSTQPSLNTGAGIIKAQTDTAAKMLKMLVCANGLEKMLKRLHDQRKAAGICETRPEAWYCQPVPNMTGNISFTANTPGEVTIVVPNPAEGSEYYDKFAGQCGRVTYSNFDKSAMSQTTGLDVDSDALARASKARAVAVQQMFLEMSAVARTITYNVYERKADDRFPLGVTSEDKRSWRSPDPTRPALLSGTELKGAAASYLGIITPSLRAKDGSVKENAGFIKQAEERGWIMAGSYFFELANLNSAARGYVGDNQPPSARTTYAVDGSNLNQVDPYVGGTVFDSSEMNIFKEMLGATETCNTDLRYGIQSTASYICNAKQIFQQGQVGIAPPDFKVDYAVTWETIPPLPNQKFKAGFLNIPGVMMTLLYNVVRVIINLLLKLFNIYLAFYLELVFKPIMLLAMPIFTSGIDMALQHVTNPIIALTVMGTNFINLAVVIWLIGMVGITALAAVPGVGQAAIVLMMFLGPFIGAWLGAMWGAGIILAYYIPILPYLLFTFAGIGWFVSVVEAMVAAPLVALAITYPEGQNELLGMAETGLKMLFAVFLRPTLLIVGFITGIIVTYVSIWLLNTGFQSILDGLLGGEAISQMFSKDAVMSGLTTGIVNSGNAVPTKVHGFAAMIGIIFMIVIYITTYMAIVKLALEKLMFKLADDVPKWIGISGTGTGVSGVPGEIEAAVEQTGAALAGAAKKAKIPTKKDLAKGAKGGGKGGSKQGGASLEGGSEGGSGAALESDGGDAPSSGDTGSSSASKKNDVSDTKDSSNKKDGSTSRASMRDDADDDEGDDATGTATAGARGGRPSSAVHSAVSAPSAPSARGGAGGAAAATAGSDESEEPASPPPAATRKRSKRIPKRPPPSAPPADD